MIRCREIKTADLEAVAELLARGFARRSRDYWIRGLQRQSVRDDVPEGFPRFGYMIDNGGVPVGVLLALYTAREDGGETTIRCNLSSWYVEDAFRNYASILSSVAQRHKFVTYVNISPAHWTRRIIEAQGFQPYCSGLFFSFPALSPPAKGMRVELVNANARTVDGLSDSDTALLARHAGYGWLSLVCRTADGRATPFVLQPMRIRRIAAPIPVMRLIYCPEVSRYLACIGALGHFLLRRGRIAVALDANGPMKQLVGFYKDSFGPKYFKGPKRPRLADLSDTELAIYGP